MQAVINMGVNIGLLPTKGLTLPLMSYGGSSLVVCCMAIGLLMRIHYETNGVAKQANRKSVKQHDKSISRSQQKRAARKQANHIKAGGALL